MASKTISTKQKEVQRIGDILSKAVAQHRLKPGQRLVESQIVETLKANRNHVQVALQRLAIQKIITIAPNCGAMVSKPTAEEAREVFAVRRCIERGIIETITSDIIVANRKRIDAHMGIEREAARGNDRRVIVAVLSEFHKMLAEICGNSLMHDIFQNLMVRSTLIVSLYQRNDIPSCASDEHQQIVDALEQGDTKTAAAAMEAHLQELEDQLELDDHKQPEINLSAALLGLDH
jgi:DNA-binding GntR family transcriptional regulator